MKKFSINCDFGGQIAPFVIYIGQPEQTHHPLHFQADWLSKQRGGTVPPEVMDAIAKLKDLAEKNNTSLEELCVYALGAAQEEQEEQAEEEYNEDNSGGELALEGDNAPEELEPEESLQAAENTDGALEEPEEPEMQTPKKRGRKKKSEQ